MAKKNKQPIQSDEQIYTSPESIDPVVVTAYNVASPRAITTNELIDLANQELNYNMSTWSDNPLKPVFINTNPQAYYQNPENVYQNILMHTGDIFAADNARRKAHLENRNIENNLYNWSLAQQYAREARKPTEGVRDPGLNAMGAAPLIIAGGLGATALLPTSWSEAAAMVGSYLGGKTVDKVVEATTDYDTLGDAIYYGLGGDDSNSVWRFAANMLNPGYLIGGAVGTNSKNILNGMKSSFNSVNPTYRTSTLYSGIPVPKGNSNTPTLWGRVKKWFKPTASTESTTSSTSTATNTPRRTSSDQTINYSIWTPYALRKRGVNLSPSLRWDRINIRRLERNNPDVLDEIALEARDMNKTRPLSPVEFNRRLPDAFKRAKTHNRNMLKLRNNPKAKNLPQDLLQHDEALNYVDRNVQRGSWITHPYSNLLSGAPALWRQNHPILSIGEATVFNPWYGIHSYPVRTYGPELFKLLYLGPENDQVTEEPVKQEKSEYTYDNANLKEMVKRRNEQRLKADSLNNAQ